MISRRQAENAAKEKIFNRLSALDRNGTEIEVSLLGRKWFDYRRLSHMEATRRFLLDFDAAALSLINRSNHHDTKSRRYKRMIGTFFSPEVLAEPWFTRRKDGTFRASSLWGVFRNARRLADLLGMEYPDYCYGALTSALARGIDRWNSSTIVVRESIVGIAPNRWPEKTIAGYVADKYATLVHQSTDPRFRGAAYVGADDQNQYFVFLARECIRVYGCNGNMNVPSIMAQRRWGEFVKDDKAPANTTILTFLGSQHLQ